MLLLVLVGLTPLLLALVGLGVAAGIERVRETRRHARILDEIGPPTAAVGGVGANQIATFEGTLVAIGDAPRDDSHLGSFHPYGSSFLDEVNVYAVSCSTAPGGLAVALDGDGGRALLEGEAQVLRGAVETEHGASLERAGSLGVEPLARAKVKKRVGQFRIVRTGDRVRVRGAVAPAPDDDAHYRDRSNVVHLRPAPAAIGRGEPTIVIAATTTARRRTSRPLVLPALAVSALAGAALVAAAMVADLPGRLRATAPLPHATGATGTDATVKMPPACRSTVLAKLERYEVAEPARVTEGCEDPFARAMAHFAAGDFATASARFRSAALADRALVPSLAELEAHLFVHAFDAAAETVRRMLEQFYPGPSTAEKRRLECVLGILEARHERGHAGAGETAIDPRPRFVKVCDVRPFLKVARELDSNGQYGGEDDWPRATYRQDARYDAVGTPYTAVVAMRTRLAARPVALERDLLDRRIVRDARGGFASDVERLFPVEAGALHPLLATFAAELTLFYAYAGFPERAERYWPFLDHVAKLVETSKTFRKPFDTSEYEKKRLEDDSTHLTFVMSIAGAAALYAGDRPRTDRYAKLADPYTGEATRQMARYLRHEAGAEEPVVDRDWTDHKAVFAARGGGAAAIAGVLKEQRSTGRDTLSRVVPLREADRAPLVAWLRSRDYPSACPTCGASTYLGDLSDRRDAARLLGDTAERDRLHDAAERFTTALTDPEIGFELDEVETFFSKRR